MIAEQVALYLQNQGHGVENVDLFLGFQPDTPDSCITLYDITTPIIDESHALAVDQFGVQVLVRSTSYSTARDVLIGIHKDLAGFGGAVFTSGGNMIGAVFIETAPASIGKDQKGRSEWTAHYRIRVDSKNDTFRN